MSAVPEIELQGVTSVRGGYEALREIDLTLERGQCLFAMGGSGSGKSMLIKTAAGLALPAQGLVLYRGKPLSKLSNREEAAFRKYSGFVFQDAALWSNLSLFDNLALPVRLHESAWGKADVERAVRAAVETVGYGQDLRVRPAELSSGERKLIGLARALVLDPVLLFMDDPTSELDEDSAARVPDIVDRLKSRGRSLIIASAASEFASRCADTIAVMIEGKLAAKGSYLEAAEWRDPSVRGVTGRLKPREAAASWAGGLAGAWVNAIADAPESTVPELARRRPSPGDDQPMIGDIINDVPGPEPEPGSDEKDTP